MPKNSQRPKPKSTDYVSHKHTLLKLNDITEQINSIQPRNRSDAWFIHKIKNKLQCQLLCIGLTESTRSGCSCDVIGTWVKNLMFLFAGEFRKSLDAIKMPPPLIGIICDVVGFREMAPNSSFKIFLWWIWSLRLQRFYPLHEKSNTAVWVNWGKVFIYSTLTMCICHYKFVHECTVRRKWKVPVDMPWFWLQAANCRRDSADRQLDDKIRNETWKFNFR